MALTQTYCDYATGNDYKGATFTDGAYTSATKTLIKANAFTANKVNHWLYLASNDCPLAELSPDTLHPVVKRDYLSLWHAYDQSAQPLSRVNFNWRGRSISRAD